MNEKIDHFDITSIKGITADSRQVRDGYLFAALPGEVLDGHDYIKSAIERRASVILMDENHALTNSVQVLKLQRDQLHHAFSVLVGRFYNAQPPRIVAVTGTNGKSSVVHFTNQIWQALGKKSEALGTLNSGLTTPDPVTLHTRLKEFTDEAVTHCALEASSHGLSQHRLDGARVQVAAFTSFSQDHLDYHKNMDDYLQAKIRLFSEVVEEGGTAVLNADIPEFTPLRAACEARNIKIISYGCRGDLSLDVADQLPLVGYFQKMNALCALGCVIAEQGIDKQKAIEALKSLKPAPGRLQYVTNMQKNRHAYIDYAHTPDALETVLSELRKNTRGRLICVFGCGGDRDKAKRPLMGKIASTLADVTIITDDNPRTENPEDIRMQIRKNIPAGESLHDIPNRRSAIAFAVQMLNKDDVLLVAGKGHERVQILGQKSEEFDDYTEVEKALHSQECN